MTQQKYCFVLCIFCITNKNKHTVAVTQSATNACIYNQTIASLDTLSYVHIQAETNLIVALCTDVVSG